MKTQSHFSWEVILLGAVVLVGAGYGALQLFKRPDAAAAKSAVAPTAARETKPRVEPVAPPAADPVATTPATKPKGGGGGGGKKITTDPEARTALKRVGSDSNAEQYWIAAINNPLMPPQERQDLIEDLNEDGLSDTKNPGFIDLPLITARMRLVERLMPTAMDKVNADAFQEAHKDLVNMYKKLGGQ